MTTQVPVPTPSPAPPRGDRPLRTVLLVVGSALVAGLLVLATLQFVRAVSGDDDSGRYVVPASFTAVDVDVSQADVTVRYGDVDRARIDFDSAGSTLRLERQVRDDTLVVRVHRQGWWEFGFFPNAREPRLDLLLPASLEPVALSADSSAGDLTVDGRFAAMSLTTSAGDMRIAGSAASLTLESSSGDIASTGLDVAGAVVTDSSSGDTRLSFGSLPSSIRMEGSSGDIEAALPDGAYDVQASTSFGEVEQGLRSTPGASRRYTFHTSAGDVALHTR